MKGGENLAIKLQIMVNYSYHKANVIMWQKALSHSDTSKYNNW